MSVLSALGIMSADEVNRIDTGYGKITERSIAISDDVLFISNIGTIRVIDGKKNHQPTVFGGIIALLGFMIMQNSNLLGLIICVCGAAFAAWNHFRKIDIYLSIGTSDGRSTVIVSKNRIFLCEIRDFIRSKVDKNSTGGATINITNSTLEGVIAVGIGSSATTTQGAARD